MLIALFWFSVFLIFYVYIGYPFLVAVLSLREKTIHRDDQFYPTVSILIAAYNERRCAWVVWVESIATLAAGHALGACCVWPHRDALRFSPYCRFPAWFDRFAWRPVFPARSSTGERLPSRSSPQRAPASAMSSLG